MLSKIPFSRYFLFAISEFFLFYMSKVITIVFTRTPVLIGVRVVHLQLRVFSFLVLCCDVRYDFREITIPSFHHSLHRRLKIEQQEPH
jgi:hypothetical protein